MFLSTIIANRIFFCLYTLPETIMKVKHAPLGWPFSYKQVVLFQFHDYQWTSS